MVKVVGAYVRTFFQHSSIEQFGGEWLKPQPANMSWAESVIVPYVSKPLWEVSMENSHVSCPLQSNHVRKRRSDISLDPHSFPSSSQPSTALVCCISLSYNYFLSTKYPLNSSDFFRILHLKLNTWVTVWKKKRIRGLRLVTIKN